MYGRHYYNAGAALMAAACFTLADDVGANYDALVDRVTNLETTDGSLKAFVDGLKATITDLNAKLAAAGTDSTKLAAVRDGLSTLASRIDSVAAADAIIVA